MSITEQVKQIIRQNPGLTATQLTRIMRGHDGYQERIDPTLRDLLEQGHIQRRGTGGPGSPYTYYTVNT